MRVLITGGTGFVGSRLTARLAREGHSVTVLTRGPADKRVAGENISFLQGDPTAPGPWQAAVADQDVLINLAGASIFGRWTPQRKQALRDSRIATTRHLVEAVPSQSHMALFSTSAVGYYGFHGDETLKESSAPGDDFLAVLARDWEAEAMRAEEKGARVVITRFGIVLGEAGGALQQMVNPFRWFVGGPIGSGKQWISWIHIEDLVGAFVHLLGRGDLSGPFNLTAPQPVQNRDFSRTLGKVLGRPSCLPAPGFMLKLLLGEFGSVLLEGQRVVPERLLESGYAFRYPQLDAALRDLLAH